MADILPILNPYSSAGTDPAAMVDSVLNKAVKTTIDVTKKAVNSGLGK